MYYMSHISKKFVNIIVSVGLYWLLFALCITIRSEVLNIIHLLSALYVFLSTVDFISLLKKSDIKKTQPVLLSLKFLAATKQNKSIIYIAEISYLLTPLLVFSKRFASFAIISVLFSVLFSFRAFLFVFIAVKQIKQTTKQSKQTDQAIKQAKQELPPQKHTFENKTSSNRSQLKNVCYMNQRGLSKEAMEQMADKRIETAMEMYISKHNTFAFDFALCGVGPYKLESFPGTGHNYYYILEAIYRYYNKNPKSGIDNLLYRALWEPLYSGSVILPGIISAQNKNQINGISPFKLNLESLLVEPLTDTLKPLDEANPICQDFEQLLTAKIPSVCLYNKVENNCGEDITVGFNHSDKLTVLHSTWHIVNDCVWGIETPEEIVTQFKQTPLYYPLDKREARSSKSFLNFLEQSFDLDFSYLSDNPVLRLIFGEIVLGTKDEISTQSPLKKKDLILLNQELNIIEKAKSFSSYVESASVQKLIYSSDNVYTYSFKFEFSQGSNGRPESKVEGDYCKLEQISPSDIPYLKNRTADQRENYSDRCYCKWLDYPFKPDDLKPYL